MIGAMTEAIAVGGDFWVLEKPEVRVPGEFKAEVGKKSEARLDAGLVDAAVAEARKINEMHVADAKSRQIMSQLDAQAASVAGVLPGDGRRLNFGKSMARRRGHDHASRHVRCESGRPRVARWWCRSRSSPIP